jgi:peptidoglycan/xylan/chitin deacetylase (PgdA/CDA1 family)
LKIAVTIDLENDLGFLESRFGIDEGLPVILRLLQRYGIKGTFFVSGESLAYLVETGALGEIARKGHEIASHGHRHTDYRPWDYPRILDELKRSKSSLEDASGREVAGFRAPQFLLDEKVVAAVKECGFRYDSSLPDGGGISAARYLRKVRVDGNLLAEIRRSGLREHPIDSLPLVKVPHGLLWVNFLSLPLYKRLLPLLKKEMITFYLHPFDLIGAKNRVPLDFKRKVFYLKGMDGIPRLFEGLLSFWTARGAEFVTLGKVAPRHKDMP